MPDQSPPVGNQRPEASSQRSDVQLPQRGLDGATVFIDTDALQHNASIARSLAPASDILAVVKADAYGHGAIASARALAASVDGFAVARIEEACALREAGIAQPIIALSPVWSQQAAATCKREGITPVLFAADEFITQFRECADQQLPFWLKLDTGFHRLGLQQISTATAAAARSALCEAVITHFHSADQQHDDGINLQLNRFAQQLLALRPAASARLSIANSSILLRGGHDPLLAQLPGQHLNPGWTRPGIMLYGANPLEAPLRGGNTPLRPAMHFAAPVIDVRQIRTGDAVGYNQRWRAARSSTIATVAAGYADGYPRHASSGTVVAIGGQQAKLVGTVSMDTLCVDVTELTSQRPVNIGDTAELWGAQVPAERVASSAATIPYALFTGIAPRTRRQLL